MRLNCLRLRGITEAFPNEISVDFDALGPGLIALVGENGAGKSTLIGSVFAALFRQLPGQKRSLYDFATHPEPEIELAFSVNGACYRSLLKLDPRARQMESYLFDREGAPLTNGKKEPFDAMIRKCTGTSPGFLLASIFSSQKRTGNFLSLERSERKELFIRELLGLDRLRLIAATAKEKADESSKRVTGVEGQRRSLMELVSAEVEDPAIVEAELGSVSSKLQNVEAEKRHAELRVLELEAAEANRRPLMAEAETMRQRLRKTDAEIAEARRRIAEDEGLMAQGKALSTLVERGSQLAGRIEELHRRIQETQTLEVSNRETERTVQALEAELGASGAEIERLRVEREELSIVPCGGRGPYASCPKIRRAVEAGEKIPTLEGEVATLQLEAEVQRASLVQIATPSSQLTQTLENCERERRALDQERRRYEELRAVEARRDERLKAQERLGQARAELAEELAKREAALSAFSELDPVLRAARRRVDDLNGLIASFRRERDTLIARQAQINQRREQRKAARSRLGQIEAELGEEKTEVEDFTYLAQVFGPDGIQLCEIQGRDRKSPPLSTLCWRAASTTSSRSAS